MVELRTEIHELIEKVNDVQLLQAIKVLLSNGIDSDWWEELSDEEKQAIEKGLNQSEAGELIPHNIVMEEIKQKYGKIK
ncbi:MAG TPA: hypothetical protein VJ919_11665 [Tangfeifania sp.]|nr:hypothetical protein [Tangfeifania sp.]